MEKWTGVVTGGGAEAPETSPRHAIFADGTECGTRANVAVGRSDGVVQITIPLISAPKA